MRKLRTYTIEELTAQLEKRGCQTHGDKKDLIDRLRENWNSVPAITIDGIVIEEPRMLPAVPDPLVEEMQNLTQWAVNSLDLYKDELLGILFPLLAHAYLDMVINRGDIDGGTRLLAGVAKEARLFSYVIPSI